MPPPSTPSPLPKRLCVQCTRPRGACLCSHLPAVKVKTPGLRILIVQHPHEVQERLNSVALLRLVLDESAYHVVVTRHLHDDSDFAKLIAPLEQQAVLLFPDKLCGQELGEYLLQDERFASTLTTLPPSPSAPTAESTTPLTVNPALTLIVLDANWRHGREMFRQSGPLQRLPLIKLSAHEGSIYVRREPTGTCLSTLEAVALSLRQFYDYHGYRDHPSHLALMHLFRRFNEIQRQYQTQSEGSGNVQEA